MTIYHMAEHIHILVGSVFCNCISIQPKIYYKSQAQSNCGNGNPQAFWCKRRGLYSSGDIPGWYIIYESDDFVRWF